MVGTKSLPHQGGFATTFWSLKLVLMAGLLLIRGCPNKGLADGGRLERALMMGRTAFGCNGAGECPAWLKTTFDYDDWLSVEWNNFGSFFVVVSS